MFTPVESSLGAILIQAATTSYMHIEGKGIGFSSILYNSIFKPTIHSVSIVSGLFLSSVFVKKVLPSFLPKIISISSKVPTFFSSPISFLTAGALVGLGSSAGCGCTSGHMLTGISRLRWRSFIATCTFFLSAVFTTMVSGNNNKINNIVNIPNYQYDSNFTNFKENMVPLLALTLFGEIWSYLILPKINEYYKNKGENKNLIRFINGLSSGFLFGSGLFISGMTNTNKIIGFLSFLTPRNFDPSLMMIPLFTIIPNILIWKKFVPQSNIEVINDKNNKNKKIIVKKPIFENEYDLNFSDATPVKFIIGNVVFGVGWALAGICPGPGALTLFNEINFATLGSGFLYIGGFLFGSYVEKHIGAP